MENDKLEKSIIDIYVKLAEHDKKIEEIKEIIKMEDRITSSDVLCRLTTLESYFHTDTTLPHFYSLGERMRIVEEFYNKLENQNKNGFEWQKGQIDALHERIIALEEWKDLINNDYIEFKLGFPKGIESFVEVNINNIHNKIKELEEKYIEGYETAKDIIFDLRSKSNKAPHKCPVCDGIGGTKINGIIDEECKSCEGKGIVWG